jgi:hypothetical protein
MSIHNRRARVAATLLFVGGLALACAAQTADKDLIDYKWQVDASWWFSSPTGFFRSANNTGYIDLTTDLNFGDYSTFTGYADWRFKPKHHLLLRVNPVVSEQTSTLTHQIEFQGVTYNIGTQITADIRSLSFSPGYQYDFLKRKQGYLGIRTEITLIDTKASLAGTVAVNGTSSTRSASGEIFAVMPILGPQGRWYPMHNSNRISLDGTVEGMYFFGYGYFLSARGFMTVAVHRHWNFTAGYQLGNRLTVHTQNTNQFGLELTQKGPIAGLEATW